MRSHHHDDGASPDIGDALALTFALPAGGATTRRIERETYAVRKIMSFLDHARRLPSSHPTSCLPSQRRDQPMCLFSMPAMPPMTTALKTLLGQ